MVNLCGSQVDSSVYLLKLLWAKSFYDNQLKHLCFTVSPCSDLNPINNNRSAEAITVPIIEFSNK